MRSLSAMASALAYATAFHLSHASPPQIPVVTRQSQWKVGQVVQTSSGPVQGHPAPNASEVSEYLGIPYAQAPTGSLRFQPPVAFRGSNTIEGSKFGPSCLASNTSGSGSGSNNSSLDKLGLTPSGAYLIQQMFSTAGTPSEDCLSINVWTKPQIGEANKAVLMFIYGGGYVSGSADTPWYDGEFFADQEDVVLVTFNYRISVFGFPGNPSSASNLGFLDQRLAVEWVRDNIANFGGDPKRITLFGQSAGGGAVDYYSYAWTDDPIVHGFIPQSGTAAGLGVQTPQRASDAWFNVTTRLGCGGATNNHDAVLKCMQDKPAQDISNAVPVNFITDSDNGLAYGPTVDEKIVFSDYSTRRPIAAPILVGNTDFEAGLYRLLAPDFPDEIWNMVNQKALVCPAGDRAAKSVAFGNPAWRYRYMGVFPNMILTTTPPSGAWHASELAVLFGTSPTHILPNTAEEVAIGKYMRGAWATFAKDPKNGLTNYGGGWPQYSPDAPTLIRLGLNNQTGPNLALGSQYDIGCEAPSGNSSTNSTTPTARPSSTPSSPPSPVGTNHAFGLGASGWLTTWTVVGLGFFLL